MGNFFYESLKNPSKGLITDPVSEPLGVVLLAETLDGFDGDVTKNREILKLFKAKAYAG